MPIYGTIAFKIVHLPLAGSFILGTDLDSMYSTFRNGQVLFIYFRAGSDLGRGPYFIHKCGPAFVFCLVVRERVAGADFINGDSGIESGFYSALDLDVNHLRVQFRILSS